MDLKEIFAKVDKEQYKAALGSDDPDALRKLLESNGISLTDEQLDYIAGGQWDHWHPNPDDPGETC